MTKMIHMKISGAWRSLKVVWVKVSGSWKYLAVSWIKVAGIWRESMGCGLYCVPNPYDVSYLDTNRMVMVTTFDTNFWTASFVNTGDGISWISFVGGNTGTGDGSFTFNINDNDGPARSCDIKLVSDVPDYYVEINQDAGGISAAGGLFIDSESNPSDSTSVDVTPDVMKTSISKVDTSDGTSWFEITSGATESGDFTLSIELFGTPPTVNKGAQVRVDDDASGIHELVSVTYIYIT